MSRVLLIEDDKNLTQTIGTLLQKDYQVDTVETFQEAKELLETKKYDLYLIDILLGAREGRYNNKTGLDLCKLIRKENESVPILMLTGKKAINYKLGAFNYGADDYLCKPFNMLELRARMRALLKRAKKKDTTTPKNIFIDKNAYLVKRNGKIIDLSRREFELLEYLIANRGKVLSRESLIKNVWQTNYDITPNNVDVHIRNIRNKLDKPFKDKVIETVYGIGYKVT